MAAVHRHRLPAAGTGKTTAITQLGKTHEATDRLCHPGLSRIPVIYVTAPPAATPPMLAVEFTRILGLPATHRANMTDVIEAVCGGAIDTRVIQRMGRTALDCRQWARWGFDVMQPSCRDQYRAGPGA